MQGGKVWEKAGINVSVVYGSMPAEAYRAATSQNGSSVITPPVPISIPIKALSSHVQITLIAGPCCKSTKRERQGMCTPSCMALGLGQTA